jgi:hypothetical protein
METKHVKSDKQRIIDREQQKKLAILWRAQEIYRLANEVCEKHKAYKDADPGRGAYRDVLNAMDDLRVLLKKFKPGSGKLKYKNEKNVLNEEKGSRGLGQNCQTDADCPDDYICENQRCWYIYGEPEEESV